MIFKKRPVRTWLEYAVMTAGLRTGVNAITWAYQWGVASAALDRDPTVEEVAEYWGLTRRTAFREQAAFREAFPDMDTPAKIHASPEAQEALKRHAEFGDKIEEIGERRRARTTEFGIAQLGGLPIDP